MLRVIILGGTGFIGKALGDELLEGGHAVVALARNPEGSKDFLGGRVVIAPWDGRSAKGWLNYAGGDYAIVNLAGENLSAGRWTEEKKNRILSSRLNAGRAVVEAVSEAQQKPRVVIQSSAIGFYGSRRDEKLDESFPPGRGFLPEVCLQWEASTARVEAQGVRRAVIRTAVVLGKGGGALSRLLLPFRLFLGGPLGSGNHWFSWIHLQDEVRAIRFLLEQEGLKGVFNLSSPTPVRQKEFSRALGKALHRPSWLPTPSFTLRLLLGEMAEETILASQRVLPEKLQQAGFSFAFSNLGSALTSLM
jgi:uncharacterized protein